MMMKSSSIKRTMPIDPDQIGNTKRIKVDFVENNEKKETELMLTSKKGRNKVELDDNNKNSQPTTINKYTAKEKSSSGRSAVMEEMMIFLTGKPVNERSRYAKAIKFPSKLYYVMECGKFNDVISWTRGGTAFTVIDLPAFTTKVLSVFFGGGSKFTSFHRKLNRWSFVKVPGVKETYKHPLFRRGLFAECQRISCSGVRGNDVDAYDFEAIISPSSLLVAAVAEQPMMPLVNINNDPTTTTSNRSSFFRTSNRTTLGHSVAGNYYDTKAALLHGSATTEEEDSFGTFLSRAGGSRRFSEDSSSQEQGVVGGGMDNASFLPVPLEYTPAGILRARVGDCRGQFVKAPGLVVDATLAHNEQCFQQDVQAREQLRTDNAMIMGARAAAGFDSFAPFQSIGSSNPTSSRYSSNTTNPVRDQERFQTGPLNIHMNSRMQPSHYLTGAHQQEHQQLMLQMQQRRQMQMQMQTMSTMNQMDQNRGLDQEIQQYQMRMFSSQQDPGMPSEQVVSITQHAV